MSTLNLFASFAPKRRYDRLLDKLYAVHEEDGKKLFSATKALLCGYPDYTTTQRIADAMHNVSAIDAKRGVDYAFHVAAIALTERDKKNAFANKLPFDWLTLNGQMNVLDGVAVKARQVLLDYTKAKLASSDQDEKKKTVSHLLGLCDSSGLPVTFELRKEVSKLYGALLKNTPL